MNVSAKETRGYSGERTRSRADAGALAGMNFLSRWSQSAFWRGRQNQHARARALPRRTLGRSWLRSGFRHHPDLLREGDEARVVLIGAQEGIDQQFGRTGVVRGPGVLQPLEHLLRLLSQRITWQPHS